MTDIDKKLENIFFGEHVGRLNLLGGNSKFAHYTSAEVAISIIKNKEIWMRSAGVMNDSSEFDYGYGVLQNYWSTEEFGEILRSINPKLPAVFEILSKRRFGVQRDNVFLSCLSEHPSVEDAYGRLSMWRAYGGGNGVALILNNSFLKAGTYKYGLTTSSVAYPNAEEVSAKFAEFAERMHAANSFLKSLDLHTVASQLMRAAQFSIMAIKHPAFKEEREWRVIVEEHSQATSFVKQEVVSINGVPQLVKKLSLGSALKDSVGIDIGDLLDSILIGPTKYPEHIRLAIVSTLRDAGLGHLVSRVRCTNVPLVT